MKRIKQRGKFRVDYIVKNGACRGCTNQEWHARLKDAYEREAQLKRGGFQVSVWKEERP